LRGGLTKRFGAELRFDEVMRRAVRIPTAAKRQKGETLREEEKMKILGIDKARSKSGEIVLIIDPQLTPEVFEKFRELWNADDFSISSGSLVWTGPAHIDSEFCRQAETYLTEAEHAMKAEKNPAGISRDEFLQRVSVQTGLRCFSCSSILLVRSGSRLMFDCSQVSSRSSRIASLPGLSSVPFLFCFLQSCRPAIS
jgi:hypothetical protein